jgi:hypothetical protein
MMRYPGVPDCPVLVLGFAQGQDDSDWKAIGLLNCEDEDEVLSEKKAMENICFFSMSDLKRE